MKLELSAVRLERPETRLTTTPFPVVEIDDYLPPDLYAELLATYPDPTKGGLNHAMKSFLKSGTEPFEAFLASHPTWAGLIRYLDSDEFLGHVYEYARPTIAASRGSRGARPWCRNGRPVGSSQQLTSLWSKEVTRRLSFIEIETGIELSSMASGQRITPHSDAPYKLVSILVYFPTPGWRPEWGGGTRFFRPRTAEAERRWCTPDVNHIHYYGPEGLDLFAREMECFHTAAFTPNHFAMFCKSNHTFHSVDPIACPPDQRRNALVVNVNIKESDKAWVRSGEKLIREVGRWVRTRGQGSLRPPRTSGDGYE